MVNSFKEVSELLQFDNDDDFYVLEIIKRRKDNPSMSGDHKIYKTFYISGDNPLEDYEQEIIALCKIHNARAYIRLNKRSFKKVGFKAMSLMIKYNEEENFHLYPRAFNKACGVTPSVKSYFIIDVDDVGRSSNDLVLFAERECEPIGDKFIKIFPSPNGYHILMKPFNSRKFQEKFPDIDIHKDNPVNLYTP